MPSSSGIPGLIPLHIHVREESFKFLFIFLLLLLILAVNHSNVSLGTK